MCPLLGPKTPNVLNVSSTNCNCERVFASSAKCNTARTRTERWNAHTKRDIENPNEYLSIINFRGDHVIKASTQRPYIHSPAPKCLCKQGTTNINIIIKEQRMSSTRIFAQVNSFISRLIRCYSILIIRGFAYFTIVTNLDNKFTWRRNLPFHIWGTNRTTHVICCAKFVTLNESKLPNYIFDTSLVGNVKTNIYKFGSFVYVSQGSGTFTVANNLFEICLDFSPTCLFWIFITNI